jgi:hypothetical protein
MGTWGAKLYQDDDALDIKDQFEELIRKGETAEHITEKLLNEYDYAMDDIYLAPVFWFALADIQWKWGRLLPSVKEQALAWLDKGDDLKRWQEENPKLAVLRKKVLEELKQKLNSPQPAAKKITISRLYRCEWKIGDIFAYKLESDFAKEKGFTDKYLIMQKVDEATWYPGYIIPVVTVKITKDEIIPKTEEEINKLEYVQIFFRDFDPFIEAFNVGKCTTKDEFEMKIKAKKEEYEFDDFGLLPIYRIELITTSARIIPKKLIFIGNFLQIIPPVKEFIPRNKVELSSTQWKDFEQRVIERYCGYNLRQIFCSELIKLQLHKKSVRTQYYWTFTDFLCLPTRAFSAMSSGSMQPRSKVIVKYQVSGAFFRVNVKRQG